VIYQFGSYCIDVGGWGPGDQEAILKMPDSAGVIGYLSVCFPTAPREQLR
jgi:hypothetical protein